ncbi:zinc-finger homeodomain protein 3 [Capsicum galapagoense]
MASNNKHLVVKYLECMHNYAASSMSYIFDGCGEFCPAGAQGTPDFFICAACQCHRSFHRKMEVEVESEAELPINGTPLATIDGSPASPPQQCLARSRQLHHSHQTFNRKKVVAMPPQGGAKKDKGKGETELANQSSFTRRKCNSTATTSSGRIRLNAYQKKRILTFVKEVMGWRWTKWNNKVIPFCDEIGITTQFLKNWINYNRRIIGPLKEPSNENESVA